MGNDLRYIAQYCDCLETPWQPYQPSQQSQENESEEKQSKNSTKSQDNSGLHDDKHVIFDQPLQQNASQIKIASNINSKVFDNLSDISCETPKNKQQPDEMEILDLEKIDSLIKHEAKKKAKHKGHTQPLIIEQRAPSISGEQNNRAEDTLSNMFEQKNTKYFIDDDEAQFYHMGAKKQYKH